MISGHRYNGGMKNPSLLGGLTPDQFLRKHWQKKPLLIRGAMPDVQAPLTPEFMFRLAAREDVESRLITNFRRQWKMQHGPFAALPSTTQKNWTLLVQGVNLHDDQADQLLHQFRFIPDSRLDDLMISYATDGGGVGAHVDSYDVFLLQVHGQRRWRISAQQDLSLREGLPLKILRHFTPEQEFILNPGDMLYLPPQYAHEGTAIGECMTCSIGFRAPAWQELGEAFLAFMADSIDLPGRYCDPALQSTRQPAAISDALMDAVTRALQKLNNTAADREIFLGEYLSEPKASVSFDPPPRPVTFLQFQKIIARDGIRLHRKSRMLHRGTHIFVNGESYAPTAADRKILRQLADHRQLASAAVTNASADLLESLYQWYRDGWLDLSPRQDFQKK
jgi:50S ribosomal protein L16 3-hydroxylase